MRSSPASPTTTSEPTGLVLEIQRMSTEDGPGLRTTVFLKGCSLACRWCHNPESISAYPEVQWVGSRCIGCGTCIQVCTRSALSRTSRGIALDRQRCNGCGDCVEACPTTAMERLGTLWSASSLAAELAKDDAYFRRSGGGITISGGEPSLQTPFARAVMSDLRERSIHVAIDTCGHVGKRALLDLAEEADLLLYDLKLMDPDSHKRLTGHDNRRILHNLELLAHHPRRQSGELDLWIRTPIIPGDTDTPQNIRAIAAFLLTLPGISRWELCAFNNLCSDKYARLDRPWPYANEALLRTEELDRLVEIAVGLGIPASTVLWTGTPRRTEPLSQEGAP